MNNAKSSHPPASRSAEGAPPEPLGGGASAAGRKRKRLRKEEIVAEATRLFAERGYEGASMGDLAERVGLRKASLFHHFPSKDALYVTVLTELLASVKDAIVRAAAAEGSFPARVDALTDALTEALAGAPYAARLLVREAMDWGPVMRGGLSGAVNDVLSAGLAFARAGQSAGVFDPSLDMQQVLVTMVGIHFMPFTIDRVVEGFVGTSPFQRAFIEQRKAAVRAQTRALVLGWSKS